MILCWRCNALVRFLSDGWYCPICGQKGPPDKIATNWEEAKKLNIPYREEK